MLPDDPDAAYLWEIVTAARKVRAALDGVTREDYDANELMRLAIERLLQNIEGGGAPASRRTFVRRIPRYRGKTSSAREMSSFTSTAVSTTIVFG